MHVSRTYSVWTSDMEDHEVGNEPVKVLFASDLMFVSQITKETRPYSATRVPIEDHEEGITPEKSLTLTYLPKSEKLKKTKNHQQFFQCGEC